jgi:hypothetical protein
MKKLTAAALGALVLGGVAGAQTAGRIDLQGTWRLESYVKADTQVRYRTDGYMMFGKKHWVHVAFFNRDPRERDFSEAHHGTYEFTGPGTLTLEVDMELHMDPKTEFQKSPVWYGPPASLKGARCREEGGKVVIDLPSSAQLVLVKIE